MGKSGMTCANAKPVEKSATFSIQDPACNRYGTDGALSEMGADVASHPSFRMNGLLAIIDDATYHLMDSEWVEEAISSCRTVGTRTIASLSKPTETLTLTEKEPL